MPTEKTSQKITGDHNLFTAGGDVYVTNTLLPPLEGKVRRELTLLLQKIKHFWIDGVLIQLTQAISLYVLNKHLCPESVDVPLASLSDLASQGNQDAVDDDTIVAIFNQSERSLLILGEPGCGKTIALLKLARDLVQRAEADETFCQPVPVIFNLSSWRDNRASLLDWMLDELSNKYQVPRAISAQWFENSRLLPLLDGLDEVNAAQRAGCVAAINDCDQVLGLVGLVVTSRVEEYDQLAVRLKLYNAVRLQRLTLAQVDQHLAEQAPAPLRTLLRQHQDLLDLAQTPLMLSIMSLVYQHVDVPSALHFDEIADPRQIIFDTYIDSMFRRKGRRQSTSELSKSANS